MSAIKCNVYSAVSAVMNTAAFNERLIVIDLSADMGRAIDRSVLDNRMQPNFAISLATEYDLNALRDKYPGREITLHGNCLLFTKKAKL